MSLRRVIRTANRFGGQFDKAEEAQYICVKMAKKTVSNFDYKFKTVISQTL